MLVELKAGMDTSDVFLIVSGLSYSGGTLVDYIASRHIGQTAGPKRSSLAIRQVDTFDWLSSFQDLQSLWALHCMETSFTGGTLRPNILKVAAKPEKRFVRCKQEQIVFNVRH